MSADRIASEHVGMHRISASRPGARAHLRELRTSVAVGYYLVGRDLRVRYRQTLLGTAWAVVQPLTLGLVLALFLGRLAKIPSDGHPAGAFFIAGLVVWTYLAGAVDAATNSMVQDISLITKVYIPRMLIPLSSAASFAIDLAIAAVVATGYALLAGSPVSPRMLLIIPTCAWAVLLAASLGTLLGTLNVKYRDIRAAVRFGTQIWLFATPVAYSWTVIPDRWTTTYGLNPAAGVVSLARWALLGGGGPPVGMLVVSAGVTTLIAIAALRVFDHLEREFADII